MVPRYSVLLTPLSMPMNLAMKVEILVDGRVLNTQIVSALLHSKDTSIGDFKRLALKAALEDRAIRVSEALRATFRLYDVSGAPIDDQR